MNTKAFTYPEQCPERLDRHALLLSFRVLRSDHPALALRIRNVATVTDSPGAVAASELSTECVCDAVDALSQLSKFNYLPADANELMTLRKLLLLWMEFQQQQRCDRKEQTT